MRSQILLFITCSIVAGFTASAQCFFLANAVPDITLQCSGGNSSRTGVGYYPTKGFYYSVGMGTNPVEVFLLNGTLLDSVSSNSNFQGIWYNPIHAKWETRIAGNVAHPNFKGGSGLPKSGLFTVGSLGAPTPTSCCQLDTSSGQLLYYHNMALYKYDRATGLFTSSVSLTGLPANSLNQNCVIAPGLNKAGLYDFVNKKIYLVDINSGVFSNSVTLPPNAPTPSVNGMSYAHNRFFLFDSVSKQWRGFKINNAQDISFYGTDVLCKGQNGFVSAVTPSASPFSWAWTLPGGINQYGNNISILQPTASAVYTLQVVSSGYACVSESQFEWKYFPTLRDSNFALVGPSTVHCASVTQVTLTSVGTGYSEWYWGMGFLGSGPSIVLTPTTSMYNLQLSFRDTLGCLSFATHSIFVLGTPTVSIVPSASYICIGSSLSVTATGANSFTWNSVAQGNSFVFTPSVSTEYTVVGETGPNCKTMKVGWISVTQPPQLQIWASKSEVCANEAVSFTVFNNSSSAVVSFTWSNGSIGYVLTLTPSVTTTFSVQTVIGSDCYGSATGSILVNPCLGIDGPEDPAKEIFCFPTIGDGNVYFGGKTEDPFSLRVLDSNGRLIREMNCAGAERKLDLTEVDPGLYYLAVVNEQRKVFTFKYIKE